MMKLTSDNAGFWNTMTATRPISDARSRPIAVINKLITPAAELAPVVSRARNSEEWRSAK